MTLERTYQEFDGNDGYPWFVEKRRTGHTTVIVREGRVGTQGVIQTLGFDTEAETVTFLQSGSESLAQQQQTNAHIPGLTTMYPGLHPAVDTRTLYANFGQRAVAFVIDWVIIFSVWFMIIPLFIRFGKILLTTSTGGFSTVDIEVLLFIIWALYSILFIASGWQATPGKKVLGLIVTDTEGKKLSFVQSTKRWVLQALDYTFTLSIGLLSAAFTRKSQTLHDLLAGTLVYDKKEKEAQQHQAETAAEQQIIQCALRHRGILTALLVAGETRLSAKEAGEILQTMSLAGMCTMELNDNGTVEYHFLDFMR